MEDEERRPWWRRRPLVRRVLSVVGAVLLLGGFVWLWGWGVRALYRSTPGVGPPEQLKAITDTRTALLAGLAALGALGTFWLNARTQRFTAETLRISEANFRLAERSQKESFELTERGHVTDRYAKAIEQLGDDNLDVRLGGIYALEQIATDSRRDRDQATIVEVLSAFVRVHSDPLYQYKASLPETAAELAEPIEEQRQKAVEYVAKFKRPPVDVQATVTVLGRLPERSGVQRADLTEAHLSGATLIGADLTGAILIEADLTKADLARANLSGTTLTKAHLSGADLARANLTKADLIKADLSGATLTEAHLSGATLIGADLSGAILIEAHLSGTNLIGADLSGATLLEAHLSGTNLGGANLTEAHLEWADLTWTNLSRGNLSGATLARANLTGSDLSGANLTGADLTGSDLRKATWTDETIWPPTLRDKIRADSTKVQKSAGASAFQVRS